MPTSPSVKSTGVLESQLCLSGGTRTILQSQAMRRASREWMTATAIPEPETKTDEKEDTSTIAARVSAQSEGSVLDLVGGIRDSGETEGKVTMQANGGGIGGTLVLARSRVETRLYGERIPAIRIGLCRAHGNVFACDLASPVCSTRDLTAYTCVDHVLKPPH